MPHSNYLPYYPEIPEYSEANHFAGALLEWFSEHQRDLPWRKSYTPYEVWVSEIMLQQTQMERGTAYFTRWMKLFPTVFHVAAASLDDILKAWEGLGYYARARNLHACAQEVVSRFQGEFPDCKHALMSLPGIGPYTAGAICSIAYNQNVPLVDANVERVFSRLFDVDAPVKSKEAQTFFWQAAKACLPSGKARLFNQALMELGALVCGKTASCGRCPLVTFCRAFHLNVTAERPLAGKKTAYTQLHIVTAVLIHKGRVFVQKRLDQGAWAGLWEFPGGRLEPDETPEQGATREFLEETGLPVCIEKKLGIVHHSYTRYKITLHCFMCSLDPNWEEKTGDSSLPKAALHAATCNLWADTQIMGKLAFPAGHRKLLDLWEHELHIE